jgi:hypothetical protein
MRKLMISLAAAGTVLAFATPAAAQYYPQQSYGQQYGGYGHNGYGNNGWGQVRALQARVDSVEYQIRRLDRRDVIRDDSADRLRDDAQRIENRLHRAARNGLNPYEANEIQARIANLEQRVRYAVSYGNGRRGYGYGDRDRDHGGHWDHDNN